MKVFENKRNIAKGHKAVKALKHYPKSHIAIAGLLSFGMLLLSMLPSEHAQATRQVRIIDLSSLADEELKALPVTNQESRLETPIGGAAIQAAAIQDLAHDSTGIKRHSETVRKGDTLSQIFKRAGLSDRQLMALLGNNNDAKRLASILPGHEIEFEIDEDTLLSLRYIEDRLNSYSFELKGSDYVFSQIAREPETLLAQRSATIHESLFEAGKNAELNDSLVMELANIFGWDIDFALDIRQGDSFKVLYEEKFLDGEKIGNGKILAAEFVNKKKRYQALRYTDRNGDSQYYTPTGETMRKEFLRTPIDFSYVSSHFNLRRKHPILNRIRAHKGVDYAARTGTPIKAAGDGKISYAGKKGGYGNVVIIQHGQKYKTLYAHISKFRRGIRKGVRVKQGQVIAYVGSTGLASGPHLHYEFYVDGVVRNPLTVDLPKASAIASSELERFKSQTAVYLAKLESQDTSQQLASTQQ